MPFRLRDNLHYCLCGGRVVFLDVEEDRYFCLPFAAGAAFERLAAGTAEAGDEERLRALVSRGMLVRDPSSDRLRPALAPAPVRADLLAGAGPVSLRDLASALIHEAGAAWRLRRRSFRRLIAEAVEGSAACVDGLDPDPRLERIVSAAARLSPMVRAADRCLVRALALHAACCAKGIQVQLVFGVRVNPFGAHCWVQRGDRVLVGDYEQVRLFTPILAVG